MRTKIRALENRDSATPSHVCFESNADLRSVQAHVSSGPQTDVLFKSKRKSPPISARAATALVYGAQKQKPGAMTAPGPYSSGQLLRRGLD